MENENLEGGLTEFRIRTEYHENGWKSCPKFTADASNQERRSLMCGHMNVNLVNENCELAPDPSSVMRESASLRDAWLSAL
jgi:hypothetical protein